MRVDKNMENRISVIEEAIARIEIQQEEIVATISSLNEVLKEQTEYEKKFINSDGLYDYREYIDRKKGDDE